MAEQADVYVKNKLTDGIQVIRKLPDGSSDYEVTVAGGDEEKIYLGGTEVSLVVKAPEGTDTKNHSFRKRSDVDLSVACSRTDSNWTMKILPNDLPPDVPTTVNVTIGISGP
jgi:hypothetical protein